jgi:hypothetical protein
MLNDKSMALGSRVVDAAPGQRVNYGALGVGIGLGPSMVVTVPPPLFTVRPVRPCSPQKPTRPRMSALTTSQARIEHLHRTHHRVRAVSIHFVSIEITKHVYTGADSG